jgi:hypothetical protein
VDEGRLVQQVSRLDRAIPGQEVDQELEKVELAGAQRPAALEMVKGRSGSLAVKPGQRTYEQPESAVLCLGALDLGLRTECGLQEDPLQLAQIGGGDLPVAPNLLDREVVLVTAQIRADLRLEPALVGAEGHSAQVKRGHVAELILEVAPAPSRVAGTSGRTAP